MSEILDAFVAEFGVAGEIIDQETFDRWLGIWAVAWRRATVAERECAVGKCDALTSRVASRTPADSKTMMAFERGQIRAAEILSAAIRETDDDDV